MVHRLPIDRAPVAWTNAGTGRKVVDTMVNTTNDAFDSLVFAPGLNTYDDARVHVGPWRFGHMSIRWVQAVRARGIAVVALDPVGGRGLLAETDRALTAFDRAFAASGTLDGCRRALVVGQSTGGLIGRALASLRPDRVRGVLSVGSPHLGAPIADFAVALHGGRPRLRAALRLVGYDLDARLSSLQDLSRAGASDFAKRHPLDPETRTSYARCEAAGGEVAAPFRALDLVLKALGVDGHGDSDGFIPCASQVFGRCMGRYRLDHYSQFGVTLQASRQERARAESEFQRLVQDVLKSVETSAPPADKDV